MDNDLSAWSRWGLSLKGDERQLYWRFMTPIAVLMLAGLVIMALFPAAAFSVGLWSVFDVTRLHTLLTYGLLQAGILSSLWMLVAIGLPLIFS